MGPLYNVQSLRLRSHFFIRERKTQVQREQPLTFSDQPSQTERGRRVTHILTHPPYIPVPVPLLHHAVLIRS